LAVMVALETVKMLHKVVVAVVEVPGMVLHSVEDLVVVVRLLLDMQFPDLVDLLLLIKKQLVVS
jgi:hypothetical protein|tara:strand:+ start:855 stop:1046 length:192 start_codon:yes stop_codon:yes gene_type:complete